MISKLRRKFVLINMILVSLVLVAVLSAVCISSYTRLVDESMGAMRQVLGRGRDQMPPRLEIGEKPPDKLPEKPFSTVPVFWTLLGDDGTVQWVRGDENVTVSDEALAVLVEQALAAEGDTGVIREYDLRFLREDTKEGTKIAFADRSTQRRSMLSVVLTCLLLGLGGLGAFFAISVFLARWALRPVERAWSQQQQFVADASHELKTPLTVILANMGILLSHREEPVEGQIKWVENTKAEAERMKALVDDLLFLAKADAAKTPLLLGEFSLSDVVWSSVLPFEALAFEQGVTLTTEIVPDIRCIGHEGQLRQLAVILTDNACKYAGPKGRVTICLYTSQDKAVLTVTNTGAPIPPESLPHLFERFYRADKSRARGEGGYGLGLSIAKTITQAHGGKIAAQSEKGSTTFTVTLPRGVK